MRQETQKETQKETLGVRYQGALMGGLVRPVLTSAVLFMVITGIAYPLATTGAAQLLFPRQARGSIVARNGAGVGSEVIGQWFRKPEYFHPRPSVTTTADPNDASKSVDQPYNAASSAGSNFAPTSKKLIDAVSGRVDAYRTENGLSASDAVPADAVTASASGLDPDISVANARLQAKRVAAARDIPEQEVLTLLDAHTQARQYGLLGYPRVNVLELNVALDDKVRRVTRR
jgi:potassium-transporting ATPase KdpC subunit